VFNPSNQRAGTHAEPEFKVKPSYRLTLAALMLAQPAFADNLPLYQGQDVVVTATRTPEPVADTLSDITVINSREIRQAGQQTLAQLLQSRAGVEVSSNGGRGTLSSIFIRGANSSHTLVLVDGMRLSSAVDGATAIQNIPLDQIDHIEILRGPASGLYGSDAIGGVIQIFTRRGAGRPRPHFSISAGSYGARAVNGGFLGKSGKWRFSVDAGHLKSNGFSATNARAATYTYNPDDDGYRNTNTSGRLSYHFDHRSEAGVNWFYSDAASHFDAGVGNDAVTHQTLTEYSVYSRNRLTRRWQSLVRVGRGSDDADTHASYHNAVGTDQDQVLWQNDFTTAAGQVTAGLEHLRQSIYGANTNAYANKHRTTKSAFAGYDGRFGRQRVQVSGRYDDNSQYGHHTTGTLAYGYQFTPAWRGHISLGTGFKAPTFLDLYYPGFSNPELKPEQSRSKEAGVSYAHGAQHVRLVYFDNQIHDLIVSSLATGWVPYNISRARIKGEELSYRGVVAGLAVGATVTFQEPRDEINHQQLTRRARKFGRLSVAKAIGAWRLGGEIVASGARYDGIPNTAANQMGGYGLVNLTATYRLRRDWSLSARWGNVFDKRYVLAQGYNTPGSNVFFTLRYAPK